MRLKLDQVLRWLVCGPPYARCKHSSNNRFCAEAIGIDSRSAAVLSSITGESGPSGRQVWMSYRLLGFPRTLNSARGSVSSSSIQLRQAQAVYWPAASRLATAGLDQPSRAGYEEPPRAGAPCGVSIWRGTVGSSGAGASAARRGGHPQRGGQTTFHSDGMPNEVVGFARRVGCRMSPGTCGWFWDIPLLLGRSPQRRLSRGGSLRFMKQLVWRNTLHCGICCDGGVRGPSCND